MRWMDIDPKITVLADAKRKELENIFLKVRLKRCKKGIVASQAWIDNWRDYIDRAVASYVATITLQQQPRPK